MDSRLPNTRHVHYISIQRHAYTSCLTSSLPCMRCYMTCFTSPRTASSILSSPTEPSFCILRHSGKEAVCLHVKSTHIFTHTHMHANRKTVTHICTCTRVTRPSIHTTVRINRRTEQRGRGVVCVGCTGAQRRWQVMSWSTAAPW